MSIRLNKVTKECNVGLQTAVEFLQKNGFADIEPNPNAKISDEQYRMLVAEFKKDKGLRDDADNISRQRQHKEKKETIAIPQQETQTVRIDAVDPKPEKRIKVVGHIDLDALSGRKTVKETQSPVQQESDGSAESLNEEKNEENKLEKQTENVEKTHQEEIGAEQEDGVFRLNHSAQVTPQLKVKGHIDLDSLNQSTRPRKKSKEGFGSHWPEVKTLWGSAPRPEALEI
jgi:translation initiation factor IF-2